MLNRGLSLIGLRILDRATDSYPRVASRAFERSFVGILGSRPIAARVLRKYRKQWRTIAQELEHRKEPLKILLIVDVCIGDTVLMGGCLDAIHAAYPTADIHFICNRTGGELMTAKPGVTVHNFVQGARGFPTEEDNARLLELIERESFSVILNMGPFLDRRMLPPGARAVQMFVPFAAYMLRAWKAKETRHISHYVRSYFNELLGERGSQFEQKELPAPALPLNANTVYLSREAIEMAHAFLDSHGLVAGSGLVFLNPDATSQYGQIPFEVQVNLLRHSASLDEVTAVLLGKAYSNRGIERRLMDELPPKLAQKIVVVPHVPIEVYTALIDASDMFISGDTGPLHISACRKQGPADYKPMRNKTAVLAIYGATDSRMYGYDSEQPYHAPANQDAPSRSFSAPAVCRNISCINKFGKSCSEVRCFDGLPESEIAEYITSYFRQRTTTPITITLKPEREYAF